MQYLQYTPKNNKEGVLQDVHWSMGGFGYFPTYTLGNLASAQIFRKAKAEIPDLEGQIAKGNLKPLKKWLNQKIHKDGQIYTPDEIIKRVTGESLKADYFVNYLYEKFSKIYPGIQQVS